MVSAACGFCGRFSNMRLVRTEVIPDNRKRGDIDSDLDEICGAFTCDSCGRINVGFAFVRVGFGELGEVVWPDVADEEIEWTVTYAAGRKFPDTPTAVASAASEAVKCLSSGFLRAAVLLARSVIEATAKDKGITHGRLNDKIDAMFNEGLIREHIKDGAHEVRQFGNEMAHGDFVAPISYEDADLAITLMGEVLEEVYESPARVQRAKNARQARLTRQHSGP